MSKFAYNLPGLERDVPMSEHTTFKIGGPARFFLRSKSVDEMKRAIEYAKNADTPFFVLGAGSNLLVSDKGFDGLVIKPEFDSISQSGLKVKAEAGARMAKLVVFAAGAGLEGLEKFAGLPGNVGGAIWANLGTMGQEIESVVAEVEILDEEGNRRMLTWDDCEFGYRDSRFKHNKDIILSVTFLLKNGDKEKIKQVVAETMKYKMEVQDYEHPSAGSMFKTPEDNSAGKLIDEAGLRGHQIGGAQISEKHGNFFINAGGAKASDVKALVDLAKARVKEQFGIELEEEVIFLGDFS